MARRSPIGHELITKAPYLMQRLLAIIRAKQWLSIHLASLVFFMFISGYAAVKLGQDMNYDLHGYHYHNPQAFLSGTTLDNIAVSGVVSYENPMRDVPAYLLMSNLSPKKAGFIIGAFQGVNLWLIFEILLALLSRLKLSFVKRLGLSLVAATFTLFGVGFYSEVGTTMGDNTTSVFVLLSLLLLIISGNSKYSVKGLNTLRLLAFLCIGIAVGLKLTNVTYLIGLVVAGTLIRTHSSLIKQLLRDGGAIAAGVLVSAGYWYAKMWIAFGSPIFPFYNGVFKSDFYPAENFIDARWANAPLISSILEPFSYTKLQAISSEMSFQSPQLAIMLVGLVIMLLYTARLWFKKQPFPNLSREHVAFLVFVGVSYFVWAAQFSYYRYLIPIELLAIPVIVLALFTLTRTPILLTILLCLYINANTIHMSWGRVAWQSTNFGVTKEDFSYLEGSTVLFGGATPVSFMIPYFPSNVSAIGIGNNLSAPGQATKAMSGLIQNKIDEGLRQNSPFYGIIADEERELAEKIYGHYRFRIGTCKPIPATIRATIPLQYRVCTLHRF